MARGRVGGWFQTAVTAGNFHEVNGRDKVLVPSLKWEVLAHISFERAQSRRQAKRNLRTRGAIISETVIACCSC